jgi:LacI family transcriptional regulator
VFFADTLTPSLSVVELPLAKLGEQSALMLLRLIGGGDNEHIVVTDPSPRIVARQSTAAPRRPS